jgi:hypothetical protein
MEFTEHLKKEALIIANARRLIKASKKTINWELYSELFGTGSTTAINRCSLIGLDPDSNKTSYNDMLTYIHSLGE